MPLCKQPAMFLSRLCRIHWLEAKKRGCAPLPLCPKCKDTGWFMYDHNH